MWKRKQEAEFVPWYRARNYKGNLTEAEKRQFDAFRTQPKHPAAQWEDLPEEVQNYIMRLELELHDKKQEGAVGRAGTLSLVGAAALFLNYKGFFGTPTIWMYVASLLALVLPWLGYWYQGNKNVEEFRHSSGEEGIRQEWEVQYRFPNHQAKRDAASSED